MHPVRRRKLKTILVSGLLLSVIVALILYALRQNISLFYTPSELLTHATQQQNVRLGGLVVQGSVQHLQGLSVQFQVTDQHHAITVLYDGVLPDLFHEGKGVVVQGAWLDPVFQASTVLAKHDENYMPKVLTQALKAQQQVGEKVS